MKKSEYQKYNQEGLDRFDRLIKVGDLVAYHDNYGFKVKVGKVIWFTKGGRIRIEELLEPDGTICNDLSRSYRLPIQVIKLNNDALIDKPEK